jgi:CBS domain containing-hemolysin-like protein
MNELFFAIGVTVSVSFLCSVLEAIILSSTPTEIEQLKKKSHRRGQLLERLKLEIEETTSAILALNTVANTLGALWIGSIAQHQLGYEGVHLAIFSVIFTIFMLLFSEILPKNIGVLYRRSLQGILIYPLKGICMLTGPISWGCKHGLRFILRKTPEAAHPAEEIVLMAEKSVEEGTLSSDEKTMIINALSLDETPVHQILTPRTVVYSLPDHLTVSEVLSATPNLPFSRIPLYHNNLDHCTGILRRRDLLKAKASGQDHKHLSELAHEALFVNENQMASEVLSQCLKAQQQLALVSDEFGTFVGVLTMEDIFEHLIGYEIFEKDDVAVDMRVLAREKYKEKRRSQNKNV